MSDFSRCIRLKSEINKWNGADMKQSKTDVYEIPEQPRDSTAAAVISWRNALAAASGDVSPNGLPWCDEDEAEKFDVVAAKAFEALSEIRPTTVCGTAALGAALVLEILEVHQGRTYGPGGLYEALDAVDRIAGTGASDILRTLLTLSDSELVATRSDNADTPWLGGPVFNSTSATQSVL